MYTFVYAQVELMKKPGKGLGISIVGRRNDTGVFISDIVKGGVAEADGRLMQGDQILTVNGEDLRGATQEEAAALLKVFYMMEYIVHDQCVVVEIFNMFKGHCKPLCQVLLV